MAKGAGPGVADVASGAGCTGEVAPAGPEDGAERGERGAGKSAGGTARKNPGAAGSHGRRRGCKATSHSARSSTEECEVIALPRLAARVKPHAGHRPPLLARRVAVVPLPLGGPTTATAASRPRWWRRGRRAPALPEVRGLRLRLLHVSRRRTRGELRRDASASSAPPVDRNTAVEGLLHTAYVY